MKPRSTLLHFLVIAGSSVLATSAHAASRTWGGGNLDWTNTSASGWNAAVPVAADTANIGSGTVTVTTNITVGNTPGAINVNGGMLVISGGKLVGGAWTQGKTFTIGSGATLRLNSWGYDVAGSLGALDYGRDRLVVNGGIIEVTGNSSDSGRIFTVGSGGATLRSSVNSGQTWSLFRDGNVLYHDIRVNDSRTLTLDGTGNGAIGNYIVNTSGSGNITKAGAGTWTLTGINTYTGVTTLTGGILSVGTIGDGGVAGNLGQATNAATNIVFNGGTLKYTGASSTSNRAFTINADKTATIETTNNLSFAGATGAATNGALTKTGAGILTLTGTNTYTGATTVSGGTLLINGSTSTSSAVTVGANGTLGGTGTVGGVTTVDGALKPGNSTGLLTVGSLNLNASASTTLEINGTNRGAASNGYDALGVNTGGTIDLAGALSFEFGNLAAFAANTEFDLFSFDTTSTGDFASVVSTGFYAGTWSKSGDIWSLTDEGQTLNFSEVTGNLIVVPEPRAALLGGLGLLALLRRRR